MSVIAKLNDKLIDDWRKQAPRLWTIQLAVFWAIVCGMQAIWPAFAGLMPLPVFAGLSVLMSVAIVIARLTKQPGADV